MYEKVCPVCFERFITKRIDKGYCSAACYKKAKYHQQNPKEEQVCPNCNTKFIARKKGQVYCSPACQKTYSDRKYKDSIRFDGMKELILKRDGYKCVKCGSISNLNVHHKDHSGNQKKPNNSPDNLITLCDTCHISEHKISRWNNDEVRHENKHCLNCGKEMIVSKKRVQDGRGLYCSKECFYAARKGEHRTSFYQKCEICGKDFLTTHYKQSLGKGKYCSKECFNIGQTGKSKPKPITKQITVNCVTCGKEFPTTQYKLDNGRGKYCSKACLYESCKSNPGRPIKSQVKVNCQVCGKEFTVVKSNLESGRGKYCSRECYGKNRKTN